MSNNILLGSKRKSDSNMDECTSMNSTKKSCLEEWEEPRASKNAEVEVTRSLSTPSSPMSVTDTQDEFAHTHNTNEAGLPLVEWKGSSRDDIIGVSPTCELPPVSPSYNHRVLYAVPVQAGCVPKPRPTKVVDNWDSGYVRMPYSKSSVYPIKGSPGKLGPRWPMITEALQKHTSTSQELQETILSYNHMSSWKFTSLHHLFEEEFDEEATEAVMSNIIPRIAELALRLPDLVTQPIPLLKAGVECSLSLSQLQIASLLANAFYCTFPRRNSSKPEFANYPEINFNRFFSAYQGRSSESEEKIKCILNYFKRVTTSTPQGVVTFSRKVLDNPIEWHDSKQLFTRLHVTSTGTIEDEGKDMLQVDFANKIIGGGVLGYGCVQEEIRFVICPELIVSRLFTESLLDNEALVISGVERYNNYSGYSSSFAWTGDYIDDTHVDQSGRRCCSLVAIDAYPFSHARTQYRPPYIERELTKAFIGFCRTGRQDARLLPVATGNWGCGAFGILIELNKLYLPLSITHQIIEEVPGDLWLKSVIQLMAAAEAGRDVAYFTFGNSILRDELANLNLLLTKRSVTVGAVFRALMQYNANYIPSKGQPTCSLFTFLRAKFTPGSTLPTPPITPAQHLQKDFGKASQRSGEVIPAVQKPPKEGIFSFPRKAKKPVEEEEEMETDSASNDISNFVDSRNAEYNNTFPPLPNNNAQDVPTAQNSSKQREMMASTSSASSDTSLMTTDPETSAMDVISEVPGQTKITQYFKPRCPS